ncbi:unnamed protein product [Soboliphyme baturini]|uniref:Saposin B-type domain-containing protein n=1 Tax=Soboliphyme baturini TaxID=241478 RepID=A0A183J422_9BILA|nr:unnamed protein product [Soboliphyme baturini]
MLHAIVAARCVLMLLLGLTAMCSATPYADIYQQEDECHLNRITALKKLISPSALRDLCINCNWQLELKELQTDDHTDVVINAMITCLNAFYKIYQPESSIDEYWKSGITKKGRPMIRLG